MKTVVKYLPSKHCWQNIAAKKMFPKVCRKRFVETFLFGVGKNSSSKKCRQKNFARRGKQETKFVTELIKQANNM